MKFLPKTPNSQKDPAGRQAGFTLIELMIVIVIIAILAAIAATVYTNVQKNARDSKRRADLDAIVKALEVNKTSTGYLALATAQFSSGGIPTTDPLGYSYCANSVASTQPADPAAWTAVSGCPAGFGTVGATNPPAGTSWKICTTGETIGVVCRTSAQ